jgi:hypothetical protein
MANKLKTKKDDAKKAREAAIAAAKEAGEELTHQELGAKDEAKTDPAGGNTGVKNNAGGGSGLSVVQFSIENRDRAERLVSDMLKEFLIADS